MPGYRRGSQRDRQLVVSEEEAGLHLRRLEGVYDTKIAILDVVNLPIHLANLRCLQGGDLATALLGTLHCRRQGMP